MTASEVLKQYILELSLDHRELFFEKNEPIKTFDDLVKWCKYYNLSEYDKYSLITDNIIENECKIYHLKKHDEYSSFDNQYVYLIDGKYIQVWIPSDENVSISDFINEILEGINKVKFVELYQELVTFYRNL